MRELLFFLKRLHLLSGKILYLNLIGMVLISIFDSIGLFLLVPLLSLVGIFPINSGEHSLFSLIDSIFINIPSPMSLPFILSLYVVLILGQSFFHRNQMILNAKIQQNFLRHLREETYKSLLYAKWEFLLKKRKSDISNIMTTELGRVGTAVSLFLQFIASLIFTFIQVVIAFWLSAKMTVFVLIFGMLLMFISHNFIKKAKSLGSRTRELQQAYLASLTDDFNGVKDIKSNNLERPHIEWFQSLCGKIDSNVVEMVKLRMASQFRYKVSSAFLVAVFVYLAVSFFHAQTAQLILIVLIFSRLWPRVMSIQSNLEMIGSMLPSFQAFMKLQNESNEAKEIHDSSKYQSGDRLKISREISCSHVDFRYDESNLLYALKNVTLSISASEMTAIVGPSGAGKSTLIDILLGLSQPEKGKVLLDDIPLSEDNILSFRRSVSYVPQDPFLFNGTIRENLQIIRPDATEQQMWEALEVASADYIVNRLPQGLEAVIGDRGVRLSGGERQRLVLARAILRNPSILILDEATSALDTENERKIQQALDQLKGRMTIIIIAHRMSTISHADQIIVLDQGKVVQSGGFIELANEDGGMFSNLLHH
ncbi:ABC transporter ATP-binding protein [Metabacillus fastidiosus]|uniref:ABC transporter ATP-binding protein n=1 Tax=Metabacillus fastidiosus TaxID=1458 RepID=UPI002E1B7882|nr:ABC transporter ATP-binding protein [Metabacillus fastidiosus]